MKKNTENIQKLLHVGKMAACSTAGDIKLPVTGEMTHLGNNTLDHMYTNRQEAYGAVPRPTTSDCSLLWRWQGL